MWPPKLRSDYTSLAIEIRTAHVTLPVYQSFMQHLGNFLQEINGRIDAVYLTSVLL